MANNQITPFQLTDQFTMDNFNQRIDETNTLLQKKADASSVYTKEESISSGTRTALSLAETATPDAALAEIARQLSENKGVKIVKLWENASPTSDFPNQTISISNISTFDRIRVEFRGFKDDTKGEVSSEVKYGQRGEIHSHNDCTTSGTLYTWYRRFLPHAGGVDFSICYNREPAAVSTNSIYLIPVRIYGIKGVT